MIKVRKLLLDSGKKTVLSEYATLIPVLKIPHIKSRCCTGLFQRRNAEDTKDMKIVSA